jgi:hypothetical protein
VYTEDNRSETIEITQHNTRKHFLSVQITDSVLTIFLKNKIKLYESFAMYLYSFLYDDFHILEWFERIVGLWSDFDERKLLILDSFERKTLLELKMKDFENKQVFQISHEITLQLQIRWHLAYIQKVR